jgi:hypothetical protein
MKNQYLKWGEELPHEVPESERIQVVTTDNGTINVYREFINKQKAISKYNHHIAISLANNFKPK